VAAWLGKNHLIGLVSLELNGLFIRLSSRHSPTPRKGPRSPRCLSAGMTQSPYRIFDTGLSVVKEPEAANVECVSPRIWREMRPPELINT